MESFIGIDLAWSERNTSGAAVLDQGGNLLDVQDVLGSDETILNFIRRWESPVTIVCFDAPIVVPNTTGHRPVERILQRCFGRFDAGAYPANRGLPAFRNRVRAWDLTTRLLASGFRHDLDIKQNETVRRVLEVYPHVAQIALFHLNKTHKYKRRKTHSPEVSCRAMESYTSLLQGLKKVNPPLRIGSRWPLKSANQLMELTATQYKRYEDAIDGIFCAYIALYIGRWGLKRCTVIGDIESGYIVTPVTRVMRKCLEQKHGLS